MVEAAPPGDLDTALVGRTVTVLYWWPDDGWQDGTVARLCPRGAFSHVVAYNRQTSALRGTADTLLDSSPTAAAGCFSRRLWRRVWPGPFDPGPPALSLSLVGGSSQLPALGQEVNGYIYGSNHEQR